MNHFCDSQWKETGLIHLLLISFIAQTQGTEKVLLFWCVHVAEDPSRLVWTELDQALDRYLQN